MRTSKPPNNHSPFRDGSIRERRVNFCGVQQTTSGWLDEYRKLTTPEARREFLNYQAGQLETLPWDDLPEYWGNIGQELVAHWGKLLREEAKQAQEWLRLEITLANPSLTPGDQTLQLQVRNLTSVLARKLRVQVNATEGLEWHHPEAQQGLLEGGQETLMRLELGAQGPGRYRIAGTLAAEDLSENPLSLPFAFQLAIAEAGRPYPVLDYQPYVVGEGLPDDRTFVGRTELLHWLCNLWRQSQGKPAATLVGQRRIGKTSLLNKIIRTSLPDTPLLPVKIDIQGVNSDYDFLTETARKMTQVLEMEGPTLDPQEPYAGFKGFLLGLKANLQERRFLLMLDEADLIPQRCLGDLLPGFLRALGRGREEPLLAGTSQ